MMRSKVFGLAICGFIGVSGLTLFPQSAPPQDPVKSLVSRLDLEKYKATIKGLSQFGDRREGTERNRKAVEWIRAQLESYGCFTERVKYTYPPASSAPQTGGTGRAAAGQRATPPPATAIASGEVVTGSGGSRIRGIRRPTSVNTDPNAQPDARLRELNAEPSEAGAREQVFCTKIGTPRSDEAYIIGAHMDGHGWGEAVDDNASGTAIVMELARILSMPDVQTERSIRFVLWNNEETGFQGALAYIEQRKDLQGKEDYPGSGNFPEPTWLGMIQHDMMMWDHGMPGADGALSPGQRPESDVNIEFQTTAKFADQAMKLAFFFRDANEKYATDYPAAVGNHMTSTDSVPFMNLIPSISLRENERGMHTGAGWNPHWHQPTDVYSTYSDKDFRLGLNAAQTTLGAVAQLVGARLQK